MLPRPHQSNTALIRPGLGPLVLISSAPAICGHNKLSRVLILAVPSSYHYPCTDTVYIRHCSLMAHILGLFLHAFVSQQHKEEGDTTG